MSSERPSDPNRPANQAVGRLAVIVDAAERAALTVIDAEKEARRCLEEAQARADKIVAERLREVADQFDRNGNGGEQPAAATPPPPVEEHRPPPTVRDLPLAEEEPGEWEEEPLAEPPFELAEEPPPFRPHVVPAPEPFDAASEPAGEEESQPSGSGSASARVLATQMAVSGSSRKEIEMRLRTGFEIEDTDDILDAILGPEG
jgi:hypothetical protein